MIEYSKIPKQSCKLRRINISPFTVSVSFIIILLSMGLFSPSLCTTTRIKSFEGGSEFVGDETDIFIYPSLLSDYPGYAFLELGDVIGSLKIAALDTTTFDVGNRSIGITCGLGPRQMLGTLGLFFSSVQPENKLTYIQTVPDYVVEPKYRSTYPLLPRHEVKFIYGKSLFPFLSLGLACRTGYESTKIDTLTDISELTGNDDYSSFFDERRLWSLSAGATLRDPSNRLQLDLSMAREWISLKDRLEYIYFTNDDMDEDWEEHSYRSCEQFEKEPLTHYNARFTTYITPKWDLIVSSLLENWDFRSTLDIASSPEELGYLGNFPVQYLRIKDTVADSLGYDAIYRHFDHRYWNVGLAVRHRPTPNVLAFTGLKAGNIQSSVDLYNSSGTPIEYIRVKGDVSFAVVAGVEVCGVPGIGPFKETVVRFGSLKKIVRNDIEIKYLDDPTKGYETHGNIETIHSPEDFEFNVGIGFRTGNLLVDLIFNNRLVFSGGFFFSGQGEIPFPKITVSYKFL